MSELAVSETTSIDGAVLLRPRPLRDDRGSLTEIFRRRWIAGGREMVQGNLSVSRSGVLRGLHFHRRQTDYWVLLEGRAFVGLYDLRSGSPTNGVAAGLRVDATEGLRGLVVPPGVAHGFCAETDVVLLYLVDAYFDGSDEHGIAWDDPDLGIDWPVQAPILSARDRANPSLADARRDSPGYAPATRNLG